MYVIGLTGGIASGKSTVSRLLRQLGAYIVDADKLAREIVARDQPAWRDILDRFGPGILLSDGTINRNLLAEKVFNNLEIRKWLENITHNRIKKKAVAEMQQAAQSGFEVIVFDVPLLIEAGWQGMVDEVWVVYVTKEKQLSRLMGRDNLDQIQALQRLNSQIALAEKCKYADLVIDNNGTVENTNEQVITAWRRIQEKIQAANE